MPDDYIVSRFIGKVGLEVLTYRALDEPNAIDEIIEKQELDELRQYVRLGKSKIVWTHSFRSIYPPDFFSKMARKAIQLLMSLTF